MWTKPLDWIVPEIVIFRGKACMSPCYKRQQSYKKIARLHSCKHGGQRFSWSGLTRVFLHLPSEDGRQKTQKSGFFIKVLMHVTPGESCSMDLNCSSNEEEFERSAPMDPRNAVAQTVTKPKVLLHFFNKLQAMYGRNSCFISVHFDAPLQHYRSHITTSLYRGKVVVLF